MKHYFLHLSLSDPQSQLIDSLKSNGADLIQTSSGICLKIDKNEEDLKVLLGNDFHGKIQTIDTDPETFAGFSEDIKVFLKR